MTLEDLIVLLRKSDEHSAANDLEDVLYQLCETGQNTGREVAGGLALRSVNVAHAVRLGLEETIKAHAQVEADREIAMRATAERTERAASGADRRLAIAVAVDALKAERDPDDGERWIYLAEETGTWWSVNADSMVKLADLIANRPTLTRDEIYNLWAESDDTAIERGRRARRAQARRSR